MLDESIEEIEQFLDELVDAHEDDYKYMTQIFLSLAIKDNDWKKMDYNSDRAKFYKNKTLEIAYSYCNRFDEKEQSYLLEAYKTMFGII